MLIGLVIQLAANALGLVVAASVLDKEEGVHHRLSWPPP